MLPFTFGMEPEQGFALLLGMWMVTSTAGDITSVLFGIPGEATSAAAVLDGYPMTKRAKAVEPSVPCLPARRWGAVVGAVVLALGAPEFFALAIVGLTFVITLSGKSMLKGSS